ncbi:hypothetical protein KIPB_016567, partial [Kipferlia bialata]
AAYALVYGTQGQQGANYTPAVELVTETFPDIPPNLVAFSATINSLTVIAMAFLTPTILRKYSNKK